MVNHFRTLLLNRTADYFTGIANATYIPADFKPKTLPANLTRVREVLFPQDIDVHTEYSLASTYLRLTHTPDLLQYVKALDTRFTYLDTLGQSQTLTVPVITVSGLAADAIPKYKVLSANRSRKAELSGAYTWIIQSVTGNPNAVDIIVPGRTTVRQTITTGQIKSKNIVLIPDYFYAYFLLPSLSITGDFKFTYTCVIPPIFDYAGVVEELQKSVSAGGMTLLFKPGKDSVRNAALSELRTVYDTTAESIIRLAVIITAYVYQVDNV